MAVALYKVLQPCVRYDRVTAITFIRIKNNSNTRGSLNIHGACHRYSANSALPSPPLPSRSISNDASSVLFDPEPGLQTAGILC